MAVYLSLFFTFFAFPCQCSHQKCIKPKNPPAANINAPGGFARSFAANLMVTYTEIYGFASFAQQGLPWLEYRILPDLLQERKEVPTKNPGAFLIGVAPGKKTLGDAWKMANMRESLDVPVLKRNVNQLGVT